jgi:hypothetical protein
MNVLSDRFHAARYVTTVLDTFDLLRASDSHEKVARPQQVTPIPNANHSHRLLVKGSVKGSTISWRDVTPRRVQKLRDCLALEKLTVIIFISMGDDANFLFSCYF